MVDKSLSDLTQPISYMRRTREYYLALGYDNPYRWAHFEHVPFTVPRLKLHQMSVAIITTAALYDPANGDQRASAPYNAAAKFYQPYRQPITPHPDLRISHVAIDRVHTHGEDDGAYFPLKAMHKAAENGVISSVHPYFYGLPTNRSQKTTLEQDAEILLKWVKQDKPDAVIAVPNCPICHQSVSLVMRRLEEEGIPTLIMGCAKDIPEHVGVPRFYFSDFPLGNSAGLPNQPEAQYETLIEALSLFELATAARSSITSSQRWPSDPSWKQDYSNPAKLTADEIAERRKAFDMAKEKAAGIRNESASGTQ